MAIALPVAQESSSLGSCPSFPSFRVRVPASTSNCGPGFDTLGVAFDLYNEVIVRRTDRMGACYGGSDLRFQEREQAMVAEVAEAFFSRTEQVPFGFSFDVRGDVPLARGLGSSVTVRAGLLGALNAASGSPLSGHDIVELVADLEGHPDNAVAAVLGGFCVARSDPSTGRFVDAVRFLVGPDLIFVVLSPDLEIETSASRRTLPDSLTFPEVVKSLNSLAFLVSVFATGEYWKLRGAVTDFIHQPYRLKQIPGAEASIRAGVDAGAYTGWLSGSGSSVLCVAGVDESDAVAEAMGGVFSRLTIGFTTRHLRCDNAGLKVDQI